MQELAERAKDLLPEVLLTLLGIVQALALEVLWSALHESPHLWAGGAAAWIGWLQVLAVFQGILVVWIFYASLVLRLRWVPRVRDTSMPFLIGVGEFVLADMLAPERMHLWLYVLAAVFALSTATSVITFYVARDEPDNRAFFALLGPRMVRSLLPSIGFVAGLVLLGALVHWTGPGGRMAASAMVLANAALAAQIALLAHYWRQSILSPRGGRAR